jgi:ABC-2 type transport system permease protein
MRAEATLAMANGLYVIFLGIGGVMFPVDTLARPLHALSELLPAAPLSDILRASVQGELGPGPAWWVLLGWAIVMPLLAIRSFTWEER